MDTVSILVNTGGLLSAIAGLIALLSAAIGVFAVGCGLWAMFIADPRSGSTLAQVGFGGGFVMAISGGLMVSFNSTIRALSETIFAQGGADPEAYLNYQVSTGPTPAAVTMSLIILSFNVLGAYAILKGLYLMAMSGKPGRNEHQGFWTTTIYFVTGTIGCNALTFTDYAAGQWQVQNATRMILAGGL